VSGPLLDRIDITLQTLPVEYTKIAAPDGDELPSSFYRARVEAARERQRSRFRSQPGIFCNAQMPPAILRQHCRASPRAERMLELAVHRHGLSARAHDRILKLARTRADLEGHGQIEDCDMQLAINCRMLDRKGWLSGQPSNSARRQQSYFSKLLEPADLSAYGDPKRPV